MKVHIRHAALLLIAATILLVGCATTTEHIPTETAPVSVVAEPGEYSVKIYTMDPDASIIIPDESVPLASAAELMPNPENPLTKRQAEAMAIQYAGLSQNDVSFLFAKEDLEDGVPTFEVSFRSGNYAYEIEIAKESGDILSYEKEDFQKD